MRRVGRRSRRRSWSRWRVWDCRSMRRSSRGCPSPGPGLTEDYDRARPARCRRLRARRVKASGCFICGFLAGKRAWTMSCSTTMAPMWCPLDGSMDGRSDMLPPLDPPGCADRRTCNVNLDDLRWDRPDLDCSNSSKRGASVAIFNWTRQVCWCRDCQDDRILADETDRAKLRTRFPRGLPPRRVTLR